jgi:hypothetical protein
MRKAKKLLAALMAAAMTMSFAAVQAFADPATYEVIGGGDVKYITAPDEEILITMPTELNWGFLVDPQGLGQLQVGDLYSPDQLGKADQTIQRLKEDGSGDYEDVVVQLTPSLIFKEASVATISSKSSVDVDLGVKIEGTGEASFTATATEADLVDEVFIQLIASTTDISEMVDPEKFSGTIGRAAKKGTAADMNFFIEKCTYVCEVTTLEPFAYDFRLDDENEVHGTMLYPQGKISTTAGLDWSAYVGEAATKNVGIKVNFTADKTDKDPVPIEGTSAGNLRADTYGLIRPTTAAEDIANSVVTAPVVVVPPAPSVGFASPTGTYTTANAWQDYEFGFGGKTIASVKLSSGTSLSSGSGYRVGEGTIGFKFSSTAQRTVIVKLTGDDAEYTIVLN